AARLAMATLRPVASSIPNGKASNRSRRERACAPARMTAWRKARARVLASSPASGRQSCAPAERTDSARPPSPSRQMTTAGAPGARARAFRKSSMARAPDRDTSIRTRSNSAPAESLPAPADLSAWTIANPSRADNGSPAAPSRAPAKSTLMLADSATFPPSETPPGHSREQGMQTLPLTDRELQHPETRGFSGTGGSSGPGMLGIAPFQLFFHFRVGVLPETRQIRR